jgi:Thoeris protein ThsB, TIR-like domain
MARSVFFSFHFKNDAWRAGKIRNMGVVDGNKPVNDNDWEEVKKGGEAAIEKWIDEQLKGRSCAVVLVGAETASRKWVIREIVKAWDAKKGAVGIRIHKITDAEEKQSTAGENPFDKVTLGGTTNKLSSKVKLYNPSGTTSKEVYQKIKDNIDSWVEEAIDIRNNG